MDDLLLSMHRHYPDMTIVVVSHDLASLKRIADQVLVLRDGVSLYCGDLNGLEKVRIPISCSSCTVSQVPGRKPENSCSPPSRPGSKPGAGAEQKCRLLP